MNENMISRAGAHVLVIILAAVALPLQSQTTGSIFGTVTDESSAVVIGAKIQAVNTLTNEVRSTSSNEAGYYSFPELPVGVYVVRAELQGFKTAVRQGIELSLNRNARVDFNLSVGAVSEQVTVTSDAPLIETTTNEMGGLVDQRRVVELPLNGRNTLSLISLVPGAQRLETGNAQGFQENKANVNGQRMEDSNWMLDGGDNSSPLRNYGNVVPNPDAIQEFRVITNNYGAEYGRAAGAVINVITKSGTNEYHGSLFEFLRNRSLNARNFFEANTTPLVQNQFGGTFGGRIVRDKTFFFGSFEGFRRRTFDFRNSALVPTAAERAGDFSNSRNSAGNPIIVRDPQTNQPFSNARIPQERLSQVAIKYLDLAIPLPNYTANGPNGLYQSASEPTDNSQFLIKTDHLFSERHKLSGAYFWSDNAEGERFTTDSANIDFARRTLKTRQHNLNLHEYWIISPTKLNHFRATYTRSAGDRHVTPDNISMNDFGSRFSPLPEGPTMPPTVRVTGYFDAGAANGGPKTANHYAIADTFSWTRGRHDLKFGVEGWLRRLFDVSTAPRMGGEWTIDGLYSGNALSDLMLGQVRRLDVGIQSYKSLNSWAWYWFAQDKFRLTPKLALTIGLRYEWDTWPVHPADEIVTFRPGRQSGCVPQAPAGILFPCDNGIPRAGLENDANNFAPRFGLAYDLFGNGRTVIRTGYGISYTFSLFNALQDMQVSTPFAYTNTVRDITLGDPYAPLGGSPFPFRKDPANLRFGEGLNYGFQNPDMRTGYVQQYNFSIQQQLGKDWSIETAYVGNVGRKLIGGVDINSPLRTPTATSRDVNQRRPLWPVFQQMNERSGFLNSSYNALQARVEKRFSSGLTLLGSYTFGKWLDESSWYSDNNFFADPRNVRLDRGRGEQDQQQVLALSWVWEVPLFSNATGLRRSVLGGWSVNGIASFHSGQPLRIQIDRDNDYDGNRRNDRPNVVGDWKLSPGRPRDEVIQQWFNPAAFEHNAPGQLGNMGRNVVSGPGFKGVDLGVSKDFRITEGTKIQLRAEAFNAFNWVNLGSPEARLTSPLFGRITGTTVTSTAGGNSRQEARIIQFGLKFGF